jgi:hypothetical protein
VPTPRRPGHVPVRINPGTWGQEVERYRKGASPRVAAERERRRLEREGIPILALARCSGEGEDGTSLDGLLKVYVPIGDSAPSERPYGFVFIPTREGVLALVAFGERHPAPGTRSVYERAHKRLHGRYPDG